MNPILLQVAGLLLVAAVLYAMAKVTRGPVFPLAMMALTEDADTPSRDGKGYSYPVLAGVKIFAGSIVVIDSSGWAKPAVTATALRAVGRAKFQVDNTDGGNGDVSVEVEHGVFQYANSADSDEITKADVGNACYLVDDGTVAKTSASNTRSIAGWIRAVEADGVWVELSNIFSVDGDLVAANNLSDVASAATSRANIGANKVVMSLRATDLVAADAVVYGIVSPVAGTITKIYSVLKGSALATGDATLTGKINGTAITTGAITITESGSAIGDIDSVSPTALRTVAAGQEIQFLVGGANTETDAFAEVSVLVET